MQPPRADGDDGEGRGGDDRREPAERVGEPPLEEPDRGDRARAGQEPGYEREEDLPVGHVEEPAAADDTDDRARGCEDERCGSDRGCCSAHPRPVETRVRRAQPVAFTFAAARLFCVMKRSTAS